MVYTHVTEGNPAYEKGLLGIDAIKYTTGAIHVE